jgi:hypothetical protein
MGRAKLRKSAIAGSLKRSRKPTAPEGRQHSSNFERNDWEPFSLELLGRVFSARQKAQMYGLLELGAAAGI